MAEVTPAPAPDDAAALAAALRQVDRHEQFYIGAVQVDADTFARAVLAALAALPAHPPAPPLTEPMLTKALGEVAKVVGGDLLTGGVKYRIGLASALLEQLGSVAAHR